MNQMKSLFYTILIVFISNFSYAQIDFSSQTNGHNVSFKITQKGQGYESYIWDFGDGQNIQQSYRDTISHYFDLVSSYNVCVIGVPMPVGYPDTICKTINTYPTKIDDSWNKSNLDYKVTKTDLFISAIQPYNTLFVYDTNGRICYNEKTENDEIRVNIEGWQKGIYIITLSSNDKKHSFKVVL